MQTVPTLKERIGSLLGDSTKADVTFVVGEERERIPANAAVMSTASDTFAEMFFGSFNRERVVEIPDASPDGFRALMKYVYTDDVDITEDNAESLMKLSDKYLLSGLFGECTEWIKRNMTPSNVCRFLPLGELYGIGEECVSIFRWLNAKKKPAIFSVDVRASPLVGINEVAKHFGLPHRDECDHAAGAKVNVVQLRELCRTARTSCQHSAPWICLTCNKVFCGCAIDRHSQQTQHALHFSTCSHHIYCGQCAKLVASVPNVYEQEMPTASDSFKEMFFGDFNRERVVEIPDASPDGFRAMLRYIYTDEAAIAEDNVEAIVQLSDKYLLTGLFSSCVEWLKRNVTAANVCRFLPLGELYSDIGEMCWELVLNNGNDALNAEAFLSLSKELVAKIFASNQLAADEIAVYGRAVDWAKRQLEMNGHHDDDPAAIRATIGTVLYLIRFPLFAAEEFANGPSESGILSAECVSIFQWFTAKKIPSLFSVDARTSSLLTIEEVLKQLGAPRRGTCEHESGIKVDVRHLRKLCETARIRCQHSSPWICLTCNKAFCGLNNNCGLIHHSQQTQHGLHFYTFADVIYCGKCNKHITYETYE